MKDNSVDELIRELITELHEEGIEPLDIASTLMIHSLLIYRASLPQKEYSEIIATICNRALKINTPAMRTLH